MDTHSTQFHTTGGVDVHQHQQHAGEFYLSPTGNIQGGYLHPMRINDKCDLTSVHYDGRLEDDDDDDVKRPMNSFLLWAKIMRRKYANENPNLHNAEVSKLLGKIWNSMSNDKKRPYVEQAEKLRVLHMRTYPNYRYAPKKRKEKKGHRMISPEVAAALHSTLFDINNFSGVNTVRQDLKSFGYLRSLCETKPFRHSDPTAALIGDNGPAFRAPMDFSKRYNTSETKPMNNDNNTNMTNTLASTLANSISYSIAATSSDCQPTNLACSLPVAADLSDTSEDENNARMTLHYYPKYCSSSSTDNIVTSSKLISTLKSTNSCPSNFDELDIKPEFTDLDFPEFDSSDDSLEELSPHIKPIEDVIPEILQFNSNSNNPHHDDYSVIDSINLWSDIGELINTP